MSDNRWEFESGATSAAPAGPPTLNNGSPPMAPAGVTTTLPPRPVAAFGYADPSQGAQPPRLAPPVTEEPPKQGGRWGWRALVAFVTGGLMVAGGFGIAQLNNDPSTQTAATAPVFPASVTEDLEGLEPASFVATLLGPSVVQVETNLGLGSGIVINESTVITNNHVISGADSVVIRLSDGTVLQAEVLGSDDRTDVAVVTAPAGSNLPPAQLARDVELDVGQLTVAIGSPFQLQQTVTSGIISALNRPVQTTQTTINAMIQTDTAINPGNSGGALADRQGRVIGMNTLIQTDGQSNTNIGVGFATPIDTVMKVVDRIIAGEDLTPGFMGLEGDVDPTGLPGVVIAAVTPGSGAEAAGLSEGDRVIRIDGAPVSRIEELAGLVQSSFPGDTVVIELVRGGSELSIDVVLGER